MRYPTLSAAVTAGVGDVVTRILTVALSVVAARILGPRDLGLLGLSTIVVGFVSMVASYSDTAAVVSGHDAAPGVHAVAAVGWKALVVGGLAIAVLAASSFVAGILTNAPVDGDAFRFLLRVLLWLPVIEVIGAYPQVVLQRRLDLQFLARAQLLSPALFSTIGIWMLLKGAGARGVVLAQILATGAVTAVCWAGLLRHRSEAAPHWPTAAHWRETGREAWKLFVGGFAGFLSGRLDNLLVSSTLGVSKMSYYSMAWNASRLPVGALSRAVYTAVVPLLARVRDDRAKIQATMDELVEKSFALFAPGYALLFVMAPEVVDWLLGRQWTPVVPCLQIMCLAGLLAPIHQAAGVLLGATGKGHLWGIASVTVVIYQLLVIPGTARRWGVTGAAWADAGAAVVVSVAGWALARQAFPKIGWTSLWSALRFAVVASLASVAASVIARAIALGLIGASVRVFLLLLFYFVGLRAFRSRRERIGVVGRIGG